MQRKYRGEVGRRQENQTELPLHSDRMMPILEASLWILDYTMLYTCSHTLQCVEFEEGMLMPTNLDIDDRLILEAQKLGRHRTKKETVTAALDEYIRRRKQQQIVSLFGTIDYDPAYDYKRARRLKRS
jgi:hypothetical protein